MPNTINVENITDYLKKRFPDRIHSKPAYIAEIIKELSKENINYIEELEDLVTKYSPEEYLSRSENEMGFRLADVGVIRSLLVAKKIDEINNIIESWNLKLEALQDRRDERPFVDIGGGVASYLTKSGNKIMIEAANVEELMEISFDELGDRIGTGLPYLRRLESRLDSFRNLLLSNENA